MWISPLHDAANVQSRIYLLFTLKFLSKWPCHKKFPRTFLLFHLNENTRSIPSWFSQTSHQCPMESQTPQHLSWLLSEHSTGMLLPFSLGRVIWHLLQERYWFLHDSVSLSFLKAAIIDGIFSHVNSNLLPTLLQPVNHQLINHRSHGEKDFICVFQRCKYVLPCQKRTSLTQRLMQGAFPSFWDSDLRKCFTKGKDLHTPNIHYF